MERYERKNKGNPQRTPRSRSSMSPHLEERWIGGNIGLDLLSLFPKKYARIMGGMEEGGQDCNVNNGGEISPFRAQPKEEEGVFIPPSKNDRCRILGRIIWPSRQKSAPL
jgi:hypothetical protein